MASGWKPPGRGQHIYAVLRRDSHVADSVDAITGTKGYRTLEEAKSEAERLNALNADKGATYFVVVVRLQDGAAERLGQD